MNNIMMDFETLGNGHDPVICEISMAYFDLEGNVGDKFHFHIDPRSCLNVGLKIDQSTMEWWSKQNQATYNDVVLKAFNQGYDLKYVLNNMNQFLSDYPKINLWGNGILNDNLWLDSAFKACNIEPAYKYNSHRDVRTLVYLDEQFLKMDYKNTIEFEGLQHRSMDDCLHQIKYVTAIIKGLNGNS